MRNMSRSALSGWLLLSVILLTLSACGWSATPDKLGEYNATPTPISSSASPTIARSGGAIRTIPSISSRTANDAIVSYRWGYQVGVNFGYQDGWTNKQYADLTAAIGMTTTRISLPRDYLEENGYDAERENIEYYHSVGLTNLPCFLSPYIDGRTTIPKGLDAPIFAGGRVNPANEWASYVAKVVQHYGDIVKIWEVWNEPDFTNDSDLAHLGGAWNSRQPKPSEMMNWNGPITSYIRLMRVTYEVVHSLQPDGYVATGGITYESYLKWLLTLTDNPAGGAVTPDFPATGGAYFDVLSFHQYPFYSEQTWQNGKPREFLPSGTTHDDIANWTQKVKNLRYVLGQAGYDGSKYPAKIFVNTETGVPWAYIDSKAAISPAVQSKRAANTAAALIEAAKQNDVKQIHFYQLNDAAKENEGVDDPFKHQGMYYFLETYGMQRLTPIGIAIKAALGK